MALAGIPLWTDQSIELFHGTTDQFVHDILRSVDVRASKASRFRDFGTGFYTTTRLDKAERWALDRALLHPGTPAVIRFDVTREAIAQLECLFFVRGDRSAIDFWSFVQYCRMGGIDHLRTLRAWYEIVAGPVTGSWKRQSVIPDTDQYSFHTQTAADVLNRCRKLRVL